MSDTTATAAAGTDWLGDIASGAKAGAALGSIVPGVGTAIGAAAGAGISVLSDLADAAGLGKWLGGPDTGRASAVQSKVATAAGSITGVVDQVAQAAVLAANPAAAIALQQKLAEIAQQEHQADLDAAAKMGALQQQDVGSARQMMTAAVAAKSPAQYAPLVLSLAVIGLWTATLTGLAMLPERQEALLQDVLMLVFSYWFGTSFGSGRKTELLYSSHPTQPGIAGR